MPLARRPGPPLRRGAAARPAPPRDRCCEPEGVVGPVRGAIGFVGLVVPHLMRLLVGPDHRLLLPASALAGASLLLLADLVARLALAPAELPIGIVTALIGAPFFLYLLLRGRH
mgnify:CR=1 FL=1